MTVTFDPSRDHRVSRETATDLIRAFQTGARSDEHRASAFGRRAFENLLAQPGAEGIRIYRAQHPDGAPAMVLVAVDREGRDLDSASAVFIQNGHDCPPWCVPSGLT